jgi:very-short-patch-repair endonuclease
MDFGPLNRSGGERRLNVLITRARLRCEVFANITADEIDLSRTNAFGVRALKTFLKYAETGHLEIPLETDLDADSPFEEAVYRELLELGYEVRKQVGSAGYFIDLAVVDPNKKGRYVLGIECDGASYHSSQSARDRDRLRQQVLEGLGWRIHRIWSTDWFRNSPREISKVAEVIENALALGTTPKHVSEDVQGLTTEILPGEMIVREDNGSWMESQENSRSYQVVLPQAILHGEELHNVSSARLADWIVEIVRGESPVHIDEVTKRIMDRVGIKRSGRRIRGAMSTAAHFAKNRAMIKIKGEFLWLPDMDVPPVRDRSALPVGSKKIEYVAPEEIDAAILKAVNKSRGLTPDHIPHVAARYLGFLRIADPTRDQFEIRIHYLIAVKQLEQQGEHLVTTQGSY